MEGISTSQWLYLGVHFLSFYTSMDFSVFLFHDASVNAYVFDYACL